MTVIPTRTSCSMTTLENSQHAQHTAQSSAAGPIPRRVFASARSPRRGEVAKCGAIRGHRPEYARRAIGKRVEKRYLPWLSPLLPMSPLSS